ncbi:MAG: hypothetical protein HQK84_10180, partial [Nitrospinae bacterium]|nr:hypothetical protein [Nitrospinota bacterium]
MKIQQKITRWQLVFRVLSVFIALFAIGLYFLPLPSIGQKFLEETLKSQGVQGIVFTVKELSVNHLSIEGIKITDEASIQNVKINYSPEALLEGRVNSIEIINPVIKAEVKKGVLNSPFLNSLPTNSTSESNSAIPLLPVETISIKNATLNLTVDENIFTVSLDAEVTGNSKGLSGKHTAHILMLGEKPYFNQMNISGDFTVNQEIIEATGKINDSFNKLDLAYKTVLHHQTAKGNVNFSMKPLEFIPESYQLTNISPLLISPVTNLNGKVWVKGAIDFSKNSIVPNIDVHLENIGFTANETEIKGINTKIVINNLSPVTSNGVQKITIGSVLLS